MNVGWMLRSQATARQRMWEASVKRQQACSSWRMGVLRMLREGRVKGRQLLRRWGNVPGLQVLRGLTMLSM